MIAGLARPHACSIIRSRAGQIMRWFQLTTFKHNFLLNVIVIVYTVKCFGFFSKQEVTSLPLLNVPRLFLFIHFNFFFFRPKNNFFVLFYNKCRISIETRDDDDDGVRDEDVSDTSVTVENLNEIIINIIFTEADSFFFQNPRFVNLQKCERGLFFFKFKE